MSLPRVWAASLPEGSADGCALALAGRALNNAEGGGGGNKS